MTFLVESCSPATPPNLFFMAPAIPSANTPFDCQQERNQHYRISTFYQKFTDSW